MAIIKNGANGTFSGKVGSIVGYEWKGKGVIRGLPKVNKNRQPTERELANRQKMKLMQHFLSRVRPVIRLGFAEEAKTKNISAFNAAMSYNKKNAFTDSSTEVQIDYTKVLLSKGFLAKPEQASASAVDNGFLFTWNKPAIKDEYLRTILCSFSEDDGLSAIAICEDFAINEKQTLRYASDDSEIQKGTEVHTFMVFISTLHDKISDSVYCGMLKY